MKMRKITICIPESRLELGDLSKVLALATSFNMEVVETDMPTERGVHRKKKAGRRKGIHAEDLFAQGYYQPNGIFTYAEAKAGLEELGYSPTTIGPVLSVLSRGGCIKTIAVDRYQWVKPYLKEVKSA